VAECGPAGQTGEAIRQTSTPRVGLLQVAEQRTAEEQHDWRVIAPHQRVHAVRLVHLPSPTTWHATVIWRLSLETDRSQKVKGSPYSITERRVPKLIPVLCSQPVGDVSHKPGGRLPLLSARPAVTPATLKRAATSFAAS